MLLNAEAFFERCQCPDWPPFIPVWACRDRALRRLCDPEPDCDRQPDLSNKSQPSHPAPTPKAEPEQRLPKDEQEDDRFSEPSAPKPSRAKAEAAQGAESDEDAPLVKEPAPKRAKKPGPAAAENEEAAVAKQPAPKRRRLTEAQKCQLWREQGLELCRSKDIDYNKGFQRVHIELAALPANHWQEFLTSLGKNVAHMKSHACRALRLRILGQDSLAMIPSSADTSPPPPAPLQDEAENRGP